MNEMFKEFEFNEKPEKIIEEVNNLKLPEDYIEFMKEHNIRMKELIEKGTEIMAKELL